RGVEEDGITADTDRRTGDGARRHGETAGAEAAGAGDPREGASQLDLHAAAASGVAARNQILRNLHQPQARSRKQEGGSWELGAGSWKLEADSDKYHSQYGIQTSISPLPRLFQA